MSFDAVTYAVSKKYTKNRIDSSGVKGDKGDKGDPGPQGPKGDTGDKGQDAKIKIGTVITGDTSTVTAHTDDEGAEVLDFTLVKGETGPKGDKGDTGEMGPQGIQGEQGPKGDQGDAANVAVGNVTSGDTPSISMRKEDEITYLDFVLAKGDKGDKGDQGKPGKDGAQGPEGPEGKQGPKGETGPKGDDGNSFTIKAQYNSKEAMLAAHPVDTAQPGDAYLVNVTEDDGTVDVHTFAYLVDDHKYGDMGAPQKGAKGDKGDPGEQGPAGPKGAQGIQGLPGQDGKDGHDGVDGFSPYITFDDTTRTDGTIVSLHNKDEVTSFIVKNGKDGVGTAVTSEGETYTFTQDKDDPNMLILTDSKGKQQTVRVKGTEYKFKSDDNDPMTIHLIDKKNAQDDQKVTIPIHTTAVEGYPTPIGTIIAFMGKTAPQNYLACDGSVYKIADYKELADFIKVQFGKYDFFGGDGTTTFAVPPLNGEFLRGTGTNAHANQGSGAEVGVHQDATEIKPLYIETSGTEYVDIYADANDPVGTVNPDSEKINTGGKHWYQATGAGTYTESGASFVTARPTNTSVLYCIKYRSDTVLNNVYTIDETVIGRWVDGKPIYRKVWANLTQEDIFKIVVKNIDTPIKMYGYGTGGDADRYTVPIGYNDSSTSCNLWFQTLDHVTFQLQVSGLAGLTKINSLMFEYTKTTDDANTIPAGSNPSTYTEYSTVATDEEVQEALK